MDNGRAAVGSLRPLPQLLGGPPFLTTESPNRTALTAVLSWGTASPGVAVRPANVRLAGAQIGLPPEGAGTSSYAVVGRTTIRLGTGAGGLSGLPCGGRRLPGVGRPGPKPAPATHVASDIGQPGARTVMRHPLTSRRCHLATARALNETGGPGNPARGRPAQPCTASSVGWAGTARTDSRVPCGARRSPVAACGVATRRPSGAVGRVLRRGGAAGPDDLPASPLRALGNQLDPEDGRFT